MVQKTLLTFFFGLSFVLSLAADYVVYDLDNLPTSPTPPHDTPYTAVSGTSFNHQYGPKTMLFVYVVPTDGNEPNQKSEAALQNELNDTSQFYYDQSFRRTWFGPKVIHAGQSSQMIVPGLHVVRVDLPRTVSEYAGIIGFSRLQSDTIAAVRALGGDYHGGHLDPNNFDRIQAYGSPKLISSTGLAYLRGRFSWSGNSLSGGVVRHELGHNWGVVHANRWFGADGIPRNGQGSHSEYNDGADVMGGSGHFNAMFKNQLGFLDKTKDEILAVHESGTYRLFAHTNPESRLPETNVRSLLVPITGTTSSHKKIFLGFRHTNATPGLQNRGSWDTHAVQVHSHGTSAAHGPTSGQNDGSHLIDTTPGSRQDDDRIDAAIKIGRTYSEGPHVNGEHIYGGMHITPISRGSIQANGFTHQYIDVVIHYGEFPDNEPPTVSFASALKSAEVGVPKELTIQASDPDGDDLAFDWDYGDGGYNLVSADTQTYTWNEPGLYLLTATVSDMKGGLATAQAWVNVGEVPFQNPEPPAASLGGLAYRYFEGSFSTLPNFDNLLIVKEGTVDAVSIAPRERNTDFAFTFEGYLEFPESDIYTLYLESNDGSRLWIGDTLVIDFDGLKSNVTETRANIALNAGVHPFRLEYFHRTGNEVLELSWSTLTNERTVIPSDAYEQFDWTGNPLPTVSVSSPEAGAQFTVGANIQLEANASSPEGVTRVQYYANNALLGSAEEAPFAFVWENVSVGDYTILAVATDVNGRKTTSAPLAFSVVSPPPTRVIGLNFAATDGARTVHFGDRAGAVYAETNWNNVDTIVGDEVPLIDNAGNPTSVRATWESNGAGSGHFSTLAGDETANSRMMRSGIHRRADIEPGSRPNPGAEIRGIPYLEYDVYVYFDYRRDTGDDTLPQRYVLTPDGQDPLPPRFGRNSVSSSTDEGDFPNYDIWNGFREATALSLDASDEELYGNYVVFRNVTGSGFLVESTRRNATTVADGNDGRHRRFLNAVQIVEVPPTTPQIRVSAPVGGWHLEEGGPSLTYTVEMAIAPDEEVVVSIDGGDQLRVQPDSLTFTPEDWSFPRLVNLQAIDDDIVEGDHNGTLSHTLISAGFYDGLEIGDISVSIADNDQPSVSVYALGFPREEGEVTGVFRLVRENDPRTHLDIVVPFTVSGSATAGEDYTLTGTDLTFNPATGEGSIVLSGGEMSTDITLTPIDDDLEEGPEAAILTLGEVADFLIGEGSASLAIEDNDVGNYLTQRFGVGQISNEFDLAFHQITFTPDGSPDFYQVSVQEIDAFPSSFSGHTKLNDVTPDLGSSSLGAWEVNYPATFYGTSYDKIFVSGQGYITLAELDNNWSSTLEVHFARQRVSAFFRLLNITLHNNGGLYVGRVETPGEERTVITYHEVAIWNAANNRINAQIEMWDNGVITFSYLNISPNATNPIVGLSNRTTGIPNPFFETDFLNYRNPSINTAPIVNSQAKTTAVNGQSYSYVVRALDVNDKPLSFTLSSAPAWLSISTTGSGEAELTGTPPNAGEFPVVIAVSNGDTTTTQSFTLRVLPADGNTTPVFGALGSVPSALVERPFEWNLSASDADGDPLTFALAVGPSWLQLTDHGNGQATLSGVPGRGTVSPDEVPVVVTVSDGLDSVSESFTLLVRTAPRITFTSPRRGLVELVNREIDLHLEAEVEGFGEPVEVQWTHSDGPGLAFFSDSQSTATRIRLDTPGIHRVRLEADNGHGATTAEVIVFVEVDSTLNLENGLIGYWRMNDSSGDTLVDSSGLGNDAEVFGQVSFQQSGYDENSIRLGGSQNYARAEIGQPDVFTVSAWIKPDASPAAGTRTVFSFCNQNSNSRARVYLKNGTRELHFASHWGTAGEWRIDHVLPAGEWVHLAISYARNSTANDPVAYINGQPVTVERLSNPGGGNNGSNNIRLGSMTSNWTSWSGFLDEFRLYNREVSAEEIPYLMSPGPVNQAPDLFAGFDLEVSADSSVPLSGTVSDDGLPENPGAVLLQWNQEIGPGPGSFDDPTAAETHFVIGPWGGSYVLRLMANDGAATVSDTMQILVTDGEPFAPIIFSQPSDTIVPEGADATFAVVAGGDPEPEYQWRFEGVEIAGATADTLVVENMSEAKEGSYDVVVSNSIGSVTSDSATLTLARAPLIITAPASQTVIVGNPVTFSVEVGGREPFTYQWIKDNEPIPGATGSTLVLPSVEVDDGGLYLVEVSNADGNTTSPGALLTVLVNEAPEVTVSTPVFPNVTIPEGVHLLVEGTVTDDGLPGEAVTESWSVSEAPGGAVVQFAPNDQLTTAISFSTQGNYQLVFTADDGDLATEYTLNVEVIDASIYDDQPTAALNSEDLVLWLRLDESSGTTASDSSGNSNDATLVGGPTWQPDGGQIGGALSFSGSGQYLIMDDSPELDNTNQMSFSLWVNPSQSNNNARGLISKRSGTNTDRTYALFLFNSNRLTVDIGTQRVDTNVTIPADTWSHVGVVFDGTLAQGQSLRTYLNGELAHTGSPNITSIPNTSAPVTLGTLNEGYSPYFAGMLDEVKVYRDRALTAEEMMQSMEGGSGNIGPLVEAGEPQTVAPNATVTLSGMVWDDGLPEDPGTVSLQWTQVGGPSVALSNPNAAATDFIAEFGGTYTFRLAADDGEIKTADEVIVTVDGDGPPADYFDQWLIDHDREGEDPDTTMVNKGGMMVSLRKAFLLGVDPDDPADMIRLENISLNADGSAIEFRFTTLPNRRYFLESSADLITWTVVPGWEDGLVDDGQEHVLSLPRNGSRTFYQLRVTFE